VPTNVVGLVIFVAFLTPGFMHATQRRVLVPQNAERSALMETTAIVTVSLATNAVLLIAFGLVRWALPEHTPDVRLLLTSGSDYAVDHLPYVLAWAGGLLVVSCGAALVVARDNRVRRHLTKVFPRVILDTSAWYETFDAGANSYTHAGLELKDGGGYVSGRVTWFSTELAETGDRAIVLGPPLRLRTDDGVVDLQVQRVIVASRDIQRVDVTYISD
jgi:hypothetical protein